MSRNRVSIQPFRLPLLPLAITAVVVATVVPIELRPAVPWDWRFDAWDFIENLLLYAPLGVALHRSRWRTLIVALALSAVAETVQMGSFERFSSPYDVISNVLGALMGGWLWRNFRRTSDTDPDIAVNGLCLLTAFGGALLLLAIWALPARSAAISDWNADYALLLGNESTNDRPWRGTLSALTIVRGALSSAQVRALAQQRAELGASLGQRMLYRSSTPFDLHGGAAVRLPQSLAERLAQTIGAEGAFTIIARATTADLLQKGPARMVSFSGDTRQRNFDLGQEQDRIAFRVRTAVSGVNGEDFRAQTAPVLQRGVEALIVASYDGAISRIFINGSLYGRSNLAAAGCKIAALCESAVPIVWSTLGAAFAMIGLAFLRWRGSVQILAAAMVAGGVAIALPNVLHLVPAAVSGYRWMQYMALVGAAAIGIAAVVGSKRSPRPVP